MTDRIAGFAPEDRLLLECARVEIDAAGAKRIAALTRLPLDWKAVLEASIRHGVAPLLGRAFGQAGDDVVVPPAIREALTTLDANSARRNQRIFASLGEVVTALRADGADPVGLKDVQLAQEVYPDPALRPMGDVDLLIRHADYPAAAASLGRLGFLPRPTADIPYTLRYASGQHFRRASDDLWIDLQWNVMERECDVHGEGRFTYDGLGMWTRAVPMTVDGYELRVPTLEDMLFHLCVHLEGHYYSELVLFTDIAELLRRRGGELDWPTFIEQTRAYRSESSVYYVLVLCERLLGATVPHDVLRELEPSYFHGALLAPLYANLNTLHVSLDEIRLAASPPQPVLDELERVTRRQAARAYRLEAELDTLATRFLERGGGLILFEGEPSTRVFGDPSLPAFEPLHVFVPAGDEELLRELLPDGQVWAVQTRDPALAGEQFTLRLEVEHARGLDAALAGSGDGERSNARSALHSLRDRLRRRVPNDREVTATLVVHALAPDELAVCVAARVGSAAEDRLFRLVSLLEVVRGLGAAFDAERVLELARRHGVYEPVAAALLIAGGLGDGVAVDPSVAETVTPPRILEWARYGPSSLKRYPWLRQAYYVAFSLLTTRGARDRLGYVRHAMTTPRGAAVLPSLARQVVGGAVRSRGAQTRSLREFAYWLEPETAELIEQRLRPDPADPPRHEVGSAPAS